MVLREFVVVNGDEIIRRCRAKVAARSIPSPTQFEIEHSAPSALAQLVEVLDHSLGPHPDPPCGQLHGRELRRQGLTVPQIALDYGAVCQSITEVAVETHASISADDFLLLNGWLDAVIAGAIVECGRDQPCGPVPTPLDDTEQQGFVGHQLQHLIQTSLTALEVVKSGSAGMGGGTAAVLYGSLLAARELVERALGQGRLTAGVEKPERLIVAQFVAELATAAAPAALALGVTFTTAPVSDELTIEGDRQVLSTAMMNLLQNGFKFTRPHTTVRLSVRTTVGRILFDVEDECGGLPNGDVYSVFHPLEAASPHRDSVGRGLAFSRWAVEAHRGRIYASHLPGKGCVFTVNLPQSLALAQATS